MGPKHSFILILAVMLVATRSEATDKIHKQCASFIGKFTMAHSIVPRQAEKTKFPKTFPRQDDHYRVDINIDDKGRFYFLLNRGVKLPETLLMFDFSLNLLADGFFSTEGIVSSEMKKTGEILQFKHFQREDASLIVQQEKAFLGYSKVPWQISFGVIKSS